MKTTLLLFAFLFSPLSQAQSFSAFSGDYVLTESMGACNSNARVEVGSSLNIINQDPRDNKGWSSIKIVPGTTSFSPAAGFKVMTKVSVAGLKVSVERTTLRGGSFAGSSKDVFEFTNTNGRKGLRISLDDETKGNVSAWNIVCKYEKR